MDQAQEVQRIVWDGSLPLQINLSPSESRIYDQADPYLVHNSDLVVTSVNAAILTQLLGSLASPLVSA